MAHVFFRSNNCSSTAGSYCNTCMIGKKVQVFWPVDEQWYSGTVYEYDPTSGEHLLRYEDGDAEWVRIVAVCCLSTRAHH